MPNCLSVPLQARGSSEIEPLSLIYGSYPKLFHGLCIRLRAQLHHCQSDLVICHKVDQIIFELVFLAYTERTPPSLIIGARVSSEAIKL